MKRLSDTFRKDIIGSSLHDMASKGIGDVDYYTKWFVDDANEMLSNGDAKTVEDAMKTTESNIRQLFEGALKNAKVKAVQQLKKK